MRQSSRQLRGKVVAILVSVYSVILLTSCNRSDAAVPACPKLSRGYSFAERENSR
jgi:hypothetical protein